MYFPTLAARQLRTTPTPLEDLQDGKSGGEGLGLEESSSAKEPVLHLAPNSRKSLFCTLTKSKLTLWRIRVSA